MKMNHLALMIQYILGHKYGGDGKISFELFAQGSSRPISQQSFQISCEKLAKSLGSLNGFPKIVKKHFKCPLRFPLSKYILYKFYCISN